MELSNVTFNITEKLGSDYYTVVQKCGDFKLHVIDTMNTRFKIATSILAGLILFNLFMTAIFETKYFREVPKFWLWYLKRVEVIYFFTSLFIIAYIYIF